MGRKRTRGNTRGTPASAQTTETKTLTSAERRSSRNELSSQVHNNLITLQLKEFHSFQAAHCMFKKSGQLRKASELSAYLGMLDRFGKNDSWQILTVILSRTLNYYTFTLIFISQQTQ